MLSLLDDVGATRLVYRRIDSLTAADEAAIVGEWRLDETAPSTFNFGEGGAGSFGACEWRWTLDIALVVDGWPADPYACLNGSTDLTSSRLVELLVSGPADARISDDGTQLYLIDDQFVLRLTRVNSADVSPSITTPPTTGPVDVPQGLHNWPAPTTTATPIEDVPALLPNMPVSNATDAVRSEYESDGSGYYDYIQTWFDPDRDAYVVVTTNVAHVTTVPPELRQPVDTSGWTNEWDDAFFSTSSPPYTTLTLADDGGFVVLHTLGVTQDEVRDLARSMRRRALPEPGWELLDLEDVVPPLRRVRSHPTDRSQRRLAPERIDARRARRVDRVRRSTTDRLVRDIDHRHHRPRRRHRSRLRDRRSRRHRLVNP